MLLAGVVGRVDHGDGGKIAWRHLGPARAAMLIVISQLAVSLCDRAVWNGSAWRNSRF